MYEILLEVLLWVVLLLASVGGYLQLPDLLAGHGIIVTRTLGMTIGAVAGFLFLAAVIGPLLLLVDVRRTLIQIQEQVTQDPSRPPARVEQRVEPELG